MGAVGGQALTMVEAGDPALHIIMGVAGARNLIEAGTVAVGAAAKAGMVTTKTATTD